MNQNLSKFALFAPGNYSRFSFMARRTVIAGVISSSVRDMTKSYSRVRLVGGRADIVIVNNQPTNLDSSAVLKFDDLKAVFEYLEKVL